MSDGQRPSFLERTSSLLATVVASGHHGAGDAAPGWVGPVGAYDGVFGAIAVDIRHSDRNAGLRQPILEVAR